MAVFADPFGGMVEGRRQREQDDQRYIDLVRRIESDIAMDAFRGRSLEAQQDNNRALRAQADARLAESRRQFDATFGQRGEQFGVESDLARQRIENERRRWTPLPAVAPNSTVDPDVPPRPRREAPAPGTGTGLPDVLNAAPPPMEVSPALRRGAMGSPSPFMPLAPVDPAEALPNPFPRAPAPAAPPPVVREPRFNSDGTPYEGFRFRDFNTRGWWGGR